MVEYTSKDKVRSGVPLGGIGAGKFEFLPSGMIDYISYQNNWTKPIYNCCNEINKSANGILGFCFGIFAQADGKSQARLLQSVKLKGIPAVKKIDYQGSFPFARLSYIDGKLPVKVSLEAFSPFIPQDAKDSAMPGAVLSFKVENKTNKRVKSSVLFAGRNLVGKDPIGRYNKIVSADGLKGVCFRVKRPLPGDYTAGEVCVAASASGGARVHYYNGWNVLTKNFQLTPDDIDLKAWKYFAQDGTLPDIDNNVVVQGGNYELACALSVSFDLGPKQTKTIDFYYTWHFPRHNAGHAYQKRFKSALAAAVYIKNSKDRLRRRSSLWQDKINSSPMPEWLKDALINNLYILFSSSWWTRDNKFIMYEAPMICPLMGTLDVGFYGSVPIAAMFPELDKNCLLQFGRAQRANGYIPHDLGLSRVDMPSNGTTFYYWKDLNPKFVLMAYRDYIWTRDTSFLRKIYPYVKKALEFTFATDANHDFLPDNEGADQTFDCWYFHGTNSYTSSIFLAALKAAMRMAKAMGEKAAEARYKMWFEKGQKTFLEKLWNGRYFIASLNSVGKYDSCIVGQLTGQWYAHMLGLGYILPKDKVRRSIKTVFAYNAADSKFGATNSMLKSGKRDKKFLHSRTIWPGVCYSFSALAIYEGFTSQGLELARKVWENFTKNNKNPWNQPDLIEPDSGDYGFGDYYYRNGVVWSVYLALAAKDSRLRKQLLAAVGPGSHPLPLSQAK